MVCFFPNCMIEIYEPVDGECCPYTGERKDAWRLIDTVPADFQPNKDGSDEQTEYGNILTDSYKIYVHINTKITDKSRIKIVGRDASFEVIGFPQEWNRFHLFKKIIVQTHRHSVL